MRTKRIQRGSTLLEAIIAMGVLMVGAAGLVGMHKQSTFFVGDSRRTTRASSFAQDLAAQVELWDYADPRLANSSTGNDADLGDSADTLASDVPSVTPDHGEEDLTLGGTTWTGLPEDLLRANQMERYWNVASGGDTNGNGIEDSKQVAVMVRWRAGGSWRKTVFMVTKVNGSDRR
jgi:Tfp pilus assembly protein PilV